MVGSNKKEVINMLELFKQTCGKPKFTASTTGQDAVILDGMHTGIIEENIDYEIKIITPFYVDDEIDFQENDQSWFWTKEWQLGEIEADRDIATGNTIGPFDNIKDALHALKHTEV